MKKSWWQRFQISSALTQASIVFSAVIMFATCAYTGIAAWQLHVMQNASDDSTKQTKKLIDAANINAAASQRNAAAAERNAVAAESFDASAKSINAGITDAVGKLQAQALATESVRKTAEADSKAALKATIDNFHQDQRAWLGVCDGSLLTLEEGKPIDIDVTFCNTGRSPAYHVGTRIEFGFLPTSMPTDTSMAIEVPNESSLAEHSFEPTQAIPPQGRNKLRIEDRPSGLYSGENVDANRSDELNGRSIFYVYGDIQYMD